ncbi:nucleolar RNA helicase 2 isoform X1 [Electrophorus electricus]|uniref:nucleolar RNA helicase 2 isoform X1 n=1 Tax=Electrophorus electricus TaxID=8005 RepID=UPI0015CF9486|nr:nucleolar RNA helicase 2 isoform X1 [Electrophorus electricus]
MPTKVFTNNDNVIEMNNVDETSEIIKETKASINRKKNKTKKNTMAATEEIEECQPPAPKKIKKEKRDTANGTVQKSLDVNDNLKEPLKVKTIHSIDELMDSASDQSTEKKKKKTKAVNAEDTVFCGAPTVNSIISKSLKLQAKLSGHSTDVTPAQSSDDSSSDGEKETETPEQKEGAFSNFRISQDTIKLLQARGVTYLFDIQVKTFDSVYDGKDVIGQARTGTGKTFSFAIPLVEKLQSSSVDRNRGRAPKVLVLAPTRELAIQVTKDFKDITKKLSVVCFYGGSSYNPQVDAIRNGIDVLVGTPGRIKDHLQNNKLDLSQLKHVVLDEVDQMLDMGFAEQVEEILSASYTKDTESNPQTLLFSATCPAWVYDVAKKYMRSQYIHVDLIGKRTQKAATTVEHLAIACHWSQRAAVIGDVIQVYSGSHGRTIVFCETKKETNELSMNTSIKQSAQCLHGDIPQKQRELTLKGFRNGNFEVLIATNVAARGLDIPEVDLVMQCSPPKDVESYIHRSGRTGRAGRTGICICFYQRKEEDQLRYVEQKSGITFKRVGVPTANDIVKSSSKDAVRYLDSVPAAALEYFRSAAVRLIEERGAVEALAAALAHISGATSLEQRSLLNSDAGFTTLVLTCSQEMHNIGYAWRGLKEHLGEEIDCHIKGMTFLKGKKGVCFDVPAEKLKEIQDKWQDGRRWQLTIATELPELEENIRRNRGDRMSGGRGGGRGGSRGGFRGGRKNFSSDWRGGRGGRGGGQKRSFSQAFDY